MAEQFAHLYTAVRFESHHQESLDALVAQVSATRSGFLGKRTALRAMRGRYGVPPPTSSLNSTPCSKPLRPRLGPGLARDMSSALSGP